MWYIIVKSDPNGNRRVVGVYGSRDDAEYYAREVGGIVVKWHSHVFPTPEQLVKLLSLKAIWTAEADDYFLLEEELRDLMDKKKEL